jgi:opacity protein-like surface antigen
MPGMPARRSCLLDVRRSAQAEVDVTRERGKLFTMTRIAMARKLGTLLAIGAAVTFLTAADARAQAFISPFIGYNFGGDASCPNLRGCQNKNLNLGVGFGSLGNAAGFEQEFAYAKNFFGTGPNQGNSSVLTLMSNVMIAPKIGPVRPYVLGGLGLMKSHIELTAGNIFTSDNNNFAWDVGGGLMVLFGDHVGVRGDLRFFHAFQNLNLGVITLSSPKLDFGRASAGLVLKF